MFLSVPADGIYSCQQNPEGFGLHRRALFSIWSVDTLQSYLTFWAGRGRRVEPADGQIRTHGGSHYQVPVICRDRMVYNVLGSRVLIRLPLLTTFFKGFAPMR